MNFSLTTEEGIIEGEGKNMSMDHTDHMGMSEHHHGDHFRGMDAPGDDSGTSFLKNHPKANFTHWVKYQPHG